MKYRCLAIATAILVGCQGCQPASTTLTLATTTSTRDSGLLDELIPRFEAEAGIDVKVIAVGSGQALELGRRGDADVLLTHAPAAEQQFMSDRYGDEQHRVMHNTFVLVGPHSDPAGSENASEIVIAFQRIAGTRSRFVSRDDQSGTHRKELDIWQHAEMTPVGDWYLKAGSGMAASLRVASEKQAYTLTDRATYLALQDRLELSILCQGDSLLHNPYTLIVVSRKKHAGINHSGARRFAEFMVSPRAKEQIQSFGLEKTGESLFVPAVTDP